MKKLSSLLLFLLAGFISMAQSVAEPPPAAPDSGSSSLWVKVGLAIGAVAIMALIFYFGKKLNKKA